MATEVIVPIVKIDEIREHPNADLLCVMEVLGYQVITALEERKDGLYTRYVAKWLDDNGKLIPVYFDEQLQAWRYEKRDGKDTLIVDIGPGCIRRIIVGPKYKRLDKAVYFPADTIIPREWAEKFGVVSLLKEKPKWQEEGTILIVKKISLRGEPSFGLVVELPEDLKDKEVGENVAEYFGAEKWEPPIRPGHEDMERHDPKIDPFFSTYTDIENGRIFVDIFQPGEEVVYTEKIHGCFAAETVVMLPNGDELAISKISVGYPVLSFNTETEESEPDSVEAVCSRAATKTWVRLHFDTGRSLECTEDHLFLTSRGWVEAKDLLETDDILTP